MPEPVWSPCIKICLVDPDAALCVGCFRTMEELGRWTRLSAEQRDALRPELKCREADYRANFGKR